VFLKMTFAPSHMQINDLQASRVAPFDGEGTEATCPPRGYYLLPITRGSSKSWHSQRPASCDIGHPAIGHVRAEMARSLTLPDLPNVPRQVIAGADVNRELP